MFALADEDGTVNDAEGHLYAVERVEAAAGRGDGTWAVERLVISDNVGNLFRARPDDGGDTEGHRIKLVRLTPPEDVEDTDGHAI